MATEKLTNSIKVCLVGDAGVGKTALLIRICTGAWQSQYIPTVFDNYQLSVPVTIDGEELAFDISLWDTAGHEDYDRLRPLGYPKTDIFLICFNLNGEHTIDSIESKWFPEIVHHRPDAKRILVGLKSDLIPPRYDHSKLVFGFVHELEFYSEMNILDEIIVIIRQYESDCDDFVKSDDVLNSKIEAAMTKYECAQYVETSALTELNLTGLLHAVIDTYLHGGVEDTTNKNCCCSVL